MRIRVISDLHLDVNQKFPFSLKDSEQDEFALIAGDVSGNVKLTAKWIKANIRRGIFVCGNHDPTYNELGWTIQKQKQYLYSKFTPPSNVSFLDEQVGSMEKHIPGTNIVVIGSTLYTDYLYASEEHKQRIDSINKEKDFYNQDRITLEESNMCSGHRHLNDFRWGHVPDEIEGGEKQRHVKPEDYKKWFSDTITKMEYLLQKNAGSDVIVLTHHCPTPLCIAPEYVSGNLNASYVSDLEDFIRDHKNIKAWCCGHVHSRTLTNLKDGPLIVCNPRGYEGHFESTDWNPNTFINTDTWTIETEEYNNPRLEEARKKARENFMKYAGLFI